MNIAIVGASGAVGQEFLRILEDEKILPVTSLRLFGSERSTGRKYTFRGKEIEVELLTDELPDAFKGVDIAFTSAGAGTAKKYADLITRHGALMIDNSSAFRMDADVPLVVPEVNGPDALDTPRNIIANPNCSTIQMVVALKPIDDISPITELRVATYQAASGAGATAMQEYLDQERALVDGTEMPIHKFQHQLANNVIPHIDIFLDNDYTKEEMKMVNETHKIMHRPDMRISTTCVRVPVLRAHSEAIWITTEAPVSVTEARAAFENFSGIVYEDRPADNVYPMPLEAAGTDPVYVGRLRKDLATDNGLAFWCVADQIRKGAALNAVQIARWLHNNKK